MRLFKGLITMALAVALLALPGAALAKRGDRNHDRIPDKWEKRHHLSTHANVARRDPDKDGLTNLSEFRHHTDPQNADTDDDGVNDGTEVRDDTNPRHDDADEVSGTVTSFDNGVLTIQPAGDGSAPVSGSVNDQTRIECDDENDDAPAATMSRDGSDGGSGDGSGDNSGPGSGTSGSDDGANHDSGDTSGTGTTTQTGDDGDNHDAGDDDANEHSCTSADLKPGASVHEAKLMKAADGSTVFTKIELIPAA